GLGRGLDVDLAIAQAAGALGAAQVDLAVTGQADDDDLPLAVRVRDGDDDVLEGVRRGPRAVLARLEAVRGLDEGGDRGGVRGGLDVRGRQVRPVDGLRCDRRDGLDV